MKDNATTTYKFDDEDQLDFDFYSTDPAVFRITVGPRDGYSGFFAQAEFRAGHVASYLYSIDAWGCSRDAALAELFVQLKRYESAPEML